MKKNNKLSLSATILIASIILGGFYYVSQVNKQQSIEKQQKIELEQEHKEYVAKRKGECYKIGQTERDRWNNVDGHFYNEEKDVCTIRYENNDWREGNPFFSGMVDTNGDGEKDTWKEGKYFTKEY